MLLPSILRAALCAALVCACSEQGEGERCDPNSGSQDCESGLICRGPETLSIEVEGAGVGLCCPPEGVPPSVDACLAQARLPDENPLPDEELPAPPTVDAGGAADAGGVADAAGAADAGDGGA